MLLSIVARVIAALITIYMLGCMIRIFLTWVPGADLGAGGRVLARLTDPWLGAFSRLRFLRVGQFDFSPIAALAILAIVNQVSLTLAFSGAVTLGGILALLLDALWSAVAFILTFLSVAALVRLVAYAARWNSLHPLWRVVDNMLNPVLFRVTRLIYRGRIVNYLQGLITGFVLLVLLRVGGEALVDFGMKLLRALPF